VVRRVDRQRVKAELETLVAAAADGTIFDEPEFARTPAERRRFNDIALSGDGEPTTCPQFSEIVADIAELKSRLAITETVKTILITDACYLTKPAVMPGLAVLDESNGEIWAKLDAGTEAYFQRVNRPNYSLEHIMENIIGAARVRPVVIQSLFMRIDGQGPSRGEIEAFAERLSDIIRSGGSISEVQVYSVARTPAVSSVTALSNEELQSIVYAVRGKVNLSIVPYSC